MDMRGAGSAGPSTGRAAHGGSGGRSSKANAVGFLCKKASNRSSFFLSALAFRLPREEKRSRYLVLSACG